jgi:amidohydrolase
MTPNDLSPADLKDLVSIRRDIHAHPETAFDEHRTSALVAERLRAWGLEVHTGLARTGVVGSLRRGEGPVIGLRADMDALDMEEAADLPYRSAHPGKMHACGHDGHVAMLLGAARLLSRESGFAGTLHFIFQPAEENEAGGRVMVREGLFERFPMDAVFGLHNRPGMPVGQMGLCPGPAMAAADFFDLTLGGGGGHGGYPHQSADPVVAAAQIVSSWQALVSRGTNPLDAAVISVTRIHGGSTCNVIPAEVELSGTVRSLNESVRQRLEDGMRRMADGIAAAHGVSARLDYVSRYRTTENSPAESELMLGAMRATVGGPRVEGNLPPTMGAEDFGWLLERCPGAYGVLGNGTEGAHGAGLHNPRYDFNDAAIPIGVTFWINLVKAFFAERETV